MTEFHLYNTLTRKKEKFVPLDPPLVRIYCCGPTVYDYPHIGNFRTFVFGDLLRRSLLVNGFRIEQVMNITDVDDRTIEGAATEGKELGQYTEPFIKAFFEDLDELRIQRAEHYPRATEHIPEILDLVRRLEERGYAYKSGDSVYYRIAEFSDYGKLSRLDVSGIQQGVRIDLDKYDKENIRDFVLWKGGKDEAVGWESPYGRGRPGWHIECSAMSMKYLGESIDLHCGGVDLLFPHHENEIAQSEGATGRKFVRCWLHAEHLFVEGRKMSKSLGNYYTFRDLKAKGFKPTAVRYLLLSTHYRSQLNFTFDALGAAASAVERLRDFKKRLEDYKPEKDAREDPPIWGAETFKDALADDLAINTALAALFDFVREMNRLLDRGTLSSQAQERALSELLLIDSVLDVLTPDLEKEDEKVAKSIENLIEERNRAREQREYARADQIRDKLLSEGIILEDTPQGTRWKRKM
ncbi:MAG TPA: cysteine--tRNA ligase [archaeon]|nr:cysteine--tRNA ligase [archaeon]